MDFGGALNVSGATGCYDSAEMDSYEPAATPGVYKNGHVIVHSFVGKPTFTQS